MIKFKNITLWPFRAMSFEIKEGRLYKVLAKSDFEKNLFIKLVLGIIKPEDGQIFLFGKDLWTVEKDEFVRLFKRVGTIIGNGGLISNLRVGENIILPTWYHGTLKPQEALNRVSLILAKLGFKDSEVSEYLARTPGSLPAHEKRVVSLVRAMLTEPELIIFDPLIEGLDPEIMKKALHLIEEFHTQERGRTSVFISSEEQSLEDIRADETIRLAGGGLSE
ncbi:MAG: ATP-binding cassette domain-containing protein [Deltaproteobacteria bacterium]|nr:ATP-binding cassette domain-containing protein [Deltaproteobacteria bacterium]MBW2142244.1 ATP-binding cassette domain-containing protein [Deltaproteobacteria bacterium]